LEREEDHGETSRLRGVVTVSRNLAASSQIIENGQDEEWRRQEGEQTWCILYFQWQK